ncbi:MAG: 50S ribosomal protein L13 [Bdellovibrionales bacterium]|nr:50S ribosomal protein L13 [Bdellovibrionales bacterium]
MSKTWVKKTKDVKRAWKLIDAKGQSLGRLASLVVLHLTGKNKVDYTPHVQGGDFVIVINSDQVKLTGKKRIQKKYYTHSRYVGSLKERQAKDLSSVELIHLAVKGMLPKNTHRKQFLKQLKIFKESQHKYLDKNPVLI